MNSAVRRRGLDNQERGCEYEVDATSVVTASGKSVERHMAPQTSLAVALLLLLLAAHGTESLGSSSSSSAAEAALPLPPPHRCASAAVWLFVGAHPELGSFAVRGHQTAELLEQHTHRTRSDESRYEVMSCVDACGSVARARLDTFLAHQCGDRRLLVTHVKYVCECLLQSRPGIAVKDVQDQNRNVFHVLDTVDPGRDATLQLMRDEATARRFDAIVTTTAHLQQWWRAEHEKLNVTTPVLRVPFHHSRSSAVHEVRALGAALNTICYYGSAPDVQMVEAVQQWAETHNATFVVKTYEGPDVSRSDYLHLSEVEEMLFKDVQTCDVGIVWNQVGSSLWGKGAKNDQRLINQLAMGLPVVVYSGYAAFAAVADDMWYETTASNVKELLMQLDRMRAEPELRRALSKRGLRYAMERHSPEVVAHQYITQVASVASMRWVGRSFPAPRERAAVRDCKFYVYEGMPTASDVFQPAARLEAWLREKKLLAGTATLRQPNLVIHGMSRDVSHLLLLHALLNHPKRTKWVGDATFFYVPLGETFLNPRTNNSKTRILAQDTSLALALHRENPQWESSAACHWLATGRPSRWYFGASHSPLLTEAGGVLAASGGMQKLTVERWTTQDGDHRRPHDLTNTTLFHAMPYMPSVVNVELASRLRSGEHARTADRPNLVVGAFGARGNQTNAGRLRVALGRQCEHHPADCAMHSVAAVEDVVSLYNQSVFCLGPSGDSYARKANIDALAVGCIPVVFYHASIDYPWHLPHASNTRILIPAADVMYGKVDVVETLKKVPVARVRAMQREIASLRIAYPAQVDVTVDHMCMEAAYHDCQRRTQQLR